jgi:NADPH-dependent 2,4-dienoyl-CoA reductase/sulfur reductase-like enzyme
MEGDKPVDRSTSAPTVAVRSCIFSAGSKSSTATIAARDDHGDIYRYRRLLLATGATPRKRRSPVSVISYRTLDDYLALRRYAVPGAKIAVVGGGFIGSEIAASLSAASCR